jgi:hypothetical protein
MTAIPTYLPGDYNENERRSLESEPVVTKRHLFDWAWKIKYEKRDEKSESSGDSKDTDQSDSSDNKDDESKDASDSTDAAEDTSDSKDEASDAKDGKQDDSKDTSDSSDSSNDDSSDGANNSTGDSASDEKDNKDTSGDSGSSSNGDGEADAPTEDGDTSSGSGSDTSSGGNSTSGDDSSSDGESSSSGDSASGGESTSGGGSSSGGGGQSSSSSGSSNSTMPSSGGTAASGTMPAAAGESTLSQTMIVTGEFDGGMKRFGRGVSCTGQAEGGDSDAVFSIENGGTLRNVIIGADQIEGVHCQGACTIENVWWEDVCEDALTFKKDGDGTVTGGGAMGAADKVIQHNGVGTISIGGFTVSDFGKLYRSCGNCKTMGERHVKIDKVKATGGKATFVGINSNYGDTAIITNSCIQSTKAICEEFEGNDTGAEPKQISEGPSSACIYTDADINAC